MSGWRGLVTFMLLEAAVFFVGLRVLDVADQGEASQGRATCGAGPVAKANHQHMEASAVRN